MFDKKRACGPRKSKSNPDSYTKKELVELAIETYEIKKSDANKMTKEELCNLIKEKDDFEEEKDDFEEEEDEIKRPCGPRKNKSNNAYTKSEVIEIAISKGMKKSVANKMKISDLCIEVFGEEVDVLSDEENDGKEQDDEFNYLKCNSYTVPQLKKFAKFMGLSSDNKKKDLCKSLITHEINKLEEKCFAMKKEDIKKFADDNGISTVGSKKEICKRIMDTERAKLGVISDEDDEDDEDDVDSDYELFLRNYMKANYKERKKLLKKYEDNLPKRFLNLFDTMTEDDRNEFINSFLEPENIEKNLSSFIKEFVGNKKNKEEKDDEYPCITKSKLPLKDYQKRVVKFMLKHRGLITIFGTGKGKCHGKDTPIMMSDGTIKLVQDIKEGDFVMGDDSTPRKVLSLTRGTEPLYKIQQNGWEDYIVNESHILSLTTKDKTKMFKKEIDGITYIVGQWFDIETMDYKSEFFRYNSETEDEIKAYCKEYLDELKKETVIDISLLDYLSLSDTIKNELNGYIVSVNFEDKPVEFDPYFMGICLGSWNYIVSDIDDKEIKQKLEKKFIYNNEQIETNKFEEVFKKYNLMDNKHIPKEYKLNSREKRLQLLTGIIDKKGLYNSVLNCYTLCEESETLSKDIQYLCRTLGFKCTKRKEITVNDNPKQYYELFISSFISNISDIPVVHSKRELLNSDISSLNTHRNNDITVIPMGIGEYWGFEIDGNHRYLLEDCTVTHNSLTAVTCVQCVLTQNPKMKVLIITPTSLVDNMKKEFVAYGANPDDKRITFTTINKFSIDFENGDINPKNVFLVVDEAQNLKGYKKKGAETVIECAKKAKKVLLLTATPVMNRPSEIVNLIAMIDGEDPISPSYFEKNIMTDDDAFNDFFRCKISYVKGGTNDDFPSSEEHMVEFEMDKKYYKEYRNIEIGQESELCTSLFGCGKNIQAFYNGIRRASNNIESEKGPKINWIINKIQSENKKNKLNKTLIYSSFLDAGSKLVMKRLDKLKIPYAQIDGSMNKKRRKESVDDYNSGEISILFISKAGGEGLNLKGTRHVIITEPAWNDANLEQIKGRAVRYKSHEGLPKKDRHVDIWNLFMVKPPIEKRDDDDDTESIDIVMRDQALAKATEINDFMNKLIPLSIENSDCTGDDE